MFGISTSELVVIAFIAILIFGPERVPEFFHRAGKLIRGLQATADDVLVERLQQYSGIGKVTAWMLRAEVGRFDRFNTGK